MKRNIKRLPALLLAIILCLSLLPVTALAGSGYDFGGEGWGIKKAEESGVYTLYIESDTGMNDWVDDNKNGYYAAGVHAVDLDQTVTRIPDRAFYKCTYLTSITIF